MIPAEMLEIRDLGQYDTILNIQEDIPGMGKMEFTYGYNYVGMKSLEAPGTCRLAFQVLDFGEYKAAYYEIANHDYTQGDFESRLPGFFAAETVKHLLDVNNIDYVLALWEEGSSNYECYEKRYKEGWEFLNLKPNKTPEDMQTIEQYSAEGTWGYKRVLEPNYRVMQVIDPRIEQINFIVTLFGKPEREDSPGQIEHNIKRILQNIRPDVLFTLYQDQIAADFEDAIDLLEALMELPEAE